MLSYSMFTMRNLYYNYVQADAEDSDIEIMNDEDSDADYSDQDLQVCMILEQLKLSTPLVAMVHVTCLEMFFSIKLLCYNYNQQAYSIMYIMGTWQKKLNHDNNSYHCNLYY